MAILGSGNQSVDWRSLNVAAVVKLNSIKPADCGDFDVANLSRSNHLQQSGTITHFDALMGAAQNAIMPQESESTRDGLDCQAEVIRHIRAAHWQIQPLAIN